MSFYHVSVPEKVIGHLYFQKPKKIKKWKVSVPEKVIGHLYVMRNGAPFYQKFQYQKKLLVTCTLLCKNHVPAVNVSVPEKVIGHIHCKSNIIISLSICNDC